MQVVIRVAQREDVESLHTALGSDHHAFFRSKFELQEADLGEVLVAFKDDRPVGAVFISWDLATEPEVRAHLAEVPMLFHLHVAPAHRHRGIGRKLLREAEGQLRGRGHKRILLGVDKSNVLARDLYLWLGYTRPDEPELSDLGATKEPGEEPHLIQETYDILVADLDRPPPQWE